MMPKPSEPGNSSTMSPLIATHFRCCKSKQAHGKPASNGTHREPNRNPLGTHWEPTGNPPGSGYPLPTGNLWARNITGNLLAKTKETHKNPMGTH